MTKPICDLKLAFDFLRVAVMAMSIVTAPRVMASGLTFCETEGCTAATIENGAMVVVTKVNVNQLAEGSCAGIEKVHSANLTSGDFFKISFDSNCSYHVKFVTTDGCAGSKSTTVTPQDLADGRTNIQLIHACGNLNVKKTVPL